MLSVYAISARMVLLRQFSAVLKQLLKKKVVSIFFYFKIMTNVHISVAILLGYIKKKKKGNTNTKFSY